MVPDLYNIITTQQDPQLAEALDQFVSELLPEFKAVLFEHPLKAPSVGCISVSEAFWLYTLIRSLQPEVIIESGTFEGYSLYFCHRAAPPHARIISFDPFKEPKLRLSTVEYCRTDWTKYHWDSLLNKKTLIFFDDHLHQGKRLQQASQRHIRHILFHDNYLTPVQSHVPIRYCNLLTLAKHCYIFERLHSDPIFRDMSINPQAYRWLTYIELEDELPPWHKWFRRWRYSFSMSNPYRIR